MPSLENKNVILDSVFTPTDRSALLNINNFVDNSHMSDFFSLNNAAYIDNFDDNENHDVITNLDESGIDCVATGGSSIVFNDSNNENYIRQPLMCPGRQHSGSGLSIYFQNVNRARQKTRELFLSSCDCSSDVIILLETNFNDGFYDSEILDNRFIVFRCDRSSSNSSKKSGGGVLIAVDRKFGSELVSVPNGERVEQVCVKLSMGKKHIFVCAVYLPPDCDSSLYNLHVSSINYLLNTCDINDEFFICGDYNLPEIIWRPDPEDESLVPSNVISEKATSVADGMAALSLSQVNFIPNSRNVFLDVCFTSIPDDVTVSECNSPLLPLDIHHKSYDFFISIDDLNFNDSQEKTKCYNFKKANVPEIINYLNNIDWDNAFSGKDVNVCIEKFYETLQVCFDSYVPVFFASRKKSKHPWQSKKLKNLKNRKTRAHKWSTQNRDRTYYERVRLEYRSLHRLEYESHIEDIETNIRRDPKTFFDFANYKRKTTGLPSTMSYNGSLGDSPKSICELFANFFESVYEVNADSNIETSTQISQIESSFSNIEISMSEIETVLTSINVNKGSGDDGIPPAFVKLCADGLKIPLLHIFNLSLAQGIFPTKWKNSFLVPIFKSGKRNDVGNYRGVAILSCFAKLFEKIIYGHLFFSIKSSISTRQHGFFSGRSTVTNLIEFTSFVIDQMEDGVQVDSIYTDFSKAFDKVNHTLLIKKLRKLGFGGSFLAWIQSYLTDRKQFVKACGSRSRNFTVRSGVPQGSHLGPLLFIIFINDIISCFKSLNFLLYADDLKIFFSVRTQSDVERAQAELDNFSKWCSDNHLILNLGKCKSMTFSRSPTPIQSIYVLSGCSLSKVESISDLGVVLDPKLNFISHIDALISKASKMLGYIQRIGREFKDPYTLRSLYFAFVRSSLEYACCIWSPFYEIHKRRIENIQRRFVRFALNKLNWNPDLPNPSYCQRRQLLGIDFLFHRRQLYAAMFIRDVLCARLDCPRVLSQLDIIIYRYDVRNRVVLREGTHRTNYGKYAPLEAAKKEFNRFTALFDHGTSREVFRKKIKNALYSEPCSFCCCR
jgi:Reverse transcriptase (RNA-dependent DNA polymerase)